MNTLEALVGKGLSEWVIFQLIVYNVAWMVILAVPIAVLFSTLMAFGSMSASNEITIIKASGGSLIRMMMPVIVVSILLSYSLFLFNDIVLPESNHKAKTLQFDIMQTKPTFSIDPGQFSTQLEGYTILSRKVDSISGTLFGVTIYDLTKVHGRNIISADTGIVKFTSDFKNLKMTLYNGEVHQSVSDNVNNYKIIEFKEYQILLPARGFAFEKSEAEGGTRGDREMKISDMQEIVNSARDNFDKIKKSNKKLSQEEAKYALGLLKYTQSVPKPDSIAQQPNDTSRLAAIVRVSKRINFMFSVLESDLYQMNNLDQRMKQYEIEIQKKYALPFACIVFVFVGAPLGIITKGGSFGWSAGMTLIFYIIYWACLIGGEKLGDRGYISPFLAMWLGNFITGILGILLTIKVSWESFGVFDFTKWKMPSFLSKKKINYG